MASGMGIPSISIYSRELFTEYDVQNIIRIGSAGALRADMKLGSIVAAMGACTDSNVTSQLELGANFAPVASFELKVGSIYSSDVFYDDAKRSLRMAGLGVLAVEMEAAGLYLTAAQTGKRALTLCSISDNIITGEEMNADDRVTSFSDMVVVALETAVVMSKKE